jgi:formylglycine-generating enzyme required for sulfatase activity
MDDKGLPIRLKKNYLSLTGYRVPTEAELEYATRAGAVTSRYFGEMEDLMPKYAWHFNNSQDMTQPVGLLKPNDLGFFDVYGNTWCWCQEGFEVDPNPKEGTHSPDVEEKDLAISPTNTRSLRGGSAGDAAAILRSALRADHVPSLHQYTSGFRVARTIRP